MLLPALQQARARAKMTGCQNNLKQIGQQCFNYEMDYRQYPPGYFPHKIGTWDKAADSTWWMLLFGKRNAVGESWKANTSASSLKPLRCPADPTARRDGRPIVSYGSNRRSLSYMKYQDGTWQSNMSIDQGNCLIGDFRRSIKSASKTMTIFDLFNTDGGADAYSATWGSCLEGPVEKNNRIHVTSCNYLFWDGHVQNLDYRRWGTAEFERIFYKNGRISLK